MKNKGIAITIIIVVFIEKKKKKKGNTLNSNYNLIAS